MKTKPKTLGKINEREFVHALNELMLKADIINENQEFKRVIGSGAHGQDFNKMPYEVQNTFVGDIHGPTNFPFVIECKRRSGEPQFWKLLTDNKHEIYDWIDQVNKDADLIHKIPLLLMKFPRKGMFVATLAGIITKLKDPCDDLPNVIYCRDRRDDIWMIISWSTFEDLIMTDYDGYIKRRMICGR